MTLHLFAGLRVSDHDAAADWYTRLLGHDVATFRPNDRETVWTLGEHSHVYIEADPDRAGGGVVTLFVDDLDAALATASAGGLEPSRRETYDDGVRKAVFIDPDGNEIGMGGAPAS
ncbi:MAG: VOC family protein [Aeromicrobium sp.]|uniref:VOC family protein n=1 Tax=Aeromicrobium sp. TaxID=1871063 RepID=UPI0039E3FC35